MKSKLLFLLTFAALSVQAAPPKGLEARVEALRND